jgi:hypothetical protein
MLAGRKRSALEASLCSEDIGELVVPPAAPSAVSLAREAASAAPAAAQPQVVARLLGCLFPGVPPPTLTSRLSRPLALDVYRAPAPTPLELLARAREKKERALRRNASRAARAGDAAAAAAAPLARAPAPPAAGSLLSIALALGGGPRGAARAPPPAPSQPTSAAPRTLPGYRRAHGWGVEAPQAAAAAAHFRSAAYALSCRAAGEAALKRGFTAAMPAGGTLADVNRAELEAKRARKGWQDPSQSARERKREVSQAAGGRAPPAAPAQQPLPPSLALGPSDVPALLRAGGWALLRRARAVGAQVASVEAGGGGRFTPASAAPQHALCGTITWVGRSFFTLRTDAGKCATLQKAGCDVRLQWPVKLASSGAQGSVSVRVPAGALREGCL